MPIAIALPSSSQLTPSSYVLLAATSTFVMNILHIVATGSARKAAKIPYPLAYAPSSRTDKDAFVFNCVQRSHANFVENQVSMLGSLFIAGLRFPLASAAMGAAWSVSRYLYMRGYANGQEGGKGRYQGIVFWLFQFGLMATAGYTGIAMALGW